MDGWNVDRWILGWMDGRVEGWMSGRVGGCMNARMDEWMCGWNDCSSSPPPLPSGPTAILVADCWAVWGSIAIELPSLCGHA